MSAYLDEVADVPFHIGLPERLPRSEDAAAGVADRLSDVIFPLRSADVRSSLLAFAGAARSVRSALPLDEPVLVGDDPDESDANRDNDLAFGIVRVTGSPLWLLVEGTLKAASGVLQVTAERGAGLAADDWRDLVHGFDVTLGWIADVDVVPARLPVALPASLNRDIESGPDALVRWVRGHHVFMMLSQACAFALGCVVRRAELRQAARARTALAVATTLMMSARAALLFAGDARAEDYQSGIRPTLMPPVAPPKMSGLHWRDHEELIARMRLLSPQWAWLGAEVTDAAVAFEDALEMTYQAHRGVCQHFVGDSSPSLLSPQGSLRSATGVLDQLRRHRLSLLTGGRPATRSPRREDL